MQKALLQQNIIYIFFIHFKAVKIMNIKIIFNTKCYELIFRALLPKYCIHFRDNNISINLKARIIIVTRNINASFETVKQ